MSPCASAKLKNHNPPTPRERTNALNTWLGQSRFAIIFARGMESWRAKEATKIAEGAGINVEFGSGQASADEAELVLRRAFEQTRGTSIRTFDIAREIKKQSEVIVNQKSLDSGLVLSYSFWVIDTLGTVRNLNNKNIENFKKYVSSFLA